MNSIFGPAKAWFTSLPTSSPASDPEPAASSPNSSTSGHSHETANDMSSSSPKSTKPDDESSSDDNCFNTAIQDRLRQNPVQEIPKEDKVEDKEPFGGRFENMRAAHTKESKGTEDSDNPTKSLQAAFPISSTKHDKPTSSNTQSNNYNATSKPITNGSNKGEGNETEGAINLPVSQSASSTNRIGTPIARHSRETPSIAGAGSSKRPLVVEDIEALSRSGSVDSAKRRRLSIGRHQSGCYDQLFSKDQRQRFKREAGSSHSRIRVPLRPLSKNLVSRMSPGSSLDLAKSKEIAKSISNTPTTAGVKATEKIQQIKEGAKETQKPKRTEEQVVREFTKAPIESIFGGKPASNPTDTIVASSSQPTKDTRGKQDNKNQGSSQPSTHRTAQATQPSLSKEKPSKPRLTKADVDQFNYFKDKGPQTKSARIVNHLPSGSNEKRTGYKVTAQRATNDFQQPPKEDGRPVQTATAPKRNKPISTLASPSEHPPTPRPNINSGPKALPLALPPPHHLPAAPSAPEPAPVAAIPPLPPKKAVPAETLLSPTEIILQYVIYHTAKHPRSEIDSTRHYRRDAYSSKKEANEKCRQRWFNLIKDNPFQGRYVKNHLFEGTIFYEDGDVQLYYVHEEEQILRDVVEKRELWLDEEGTGVYAKRMWAVWAVRYYPSEEEEKEEEERVVLGMGVEVGSGRVEVMDEGNEGDDEDDGEEEEDLFGNMDVDGQLNEGVPGMEGGVVQESNEESGVMAGGGVDKPGEAEAPTRDETDNSEIQTNLNSQTEGRQTQTQESQMQQDMPSGHQSQRQTQPDSQTQPTIQTHQSLEVAQEQHERVVESRPEPKPHTKPPAMRPTRPHTEATAHIPTESSHTQPNKPNPPRPPTPPLPCTLYSPPPPSTIYSSSSESDSEDPSHTRSLLNNIPPPPPPLPSSCLLTPEFTHHGTFTTLRHANLEALEVFKALTKPETARISDILYWREEVIPDAEARFKQWSNDGKEGEGMEEKGEGEYGDGIEERPFDLEWEPDAQRYKWRFRRVEVGVKEFELKGPKDLGGLEVKMPQGSKPGLGTGAEASSHRASGSGSGSSLGNGNGNANGNGNGNAEAGAAGTASTSRASRGAGTVKMKATTAPATRTGTTTAPNNQEQWKHEKNARAVLDAKPKKRRRPTRQEKGKGKAVYPVFTTDPESNRNGAEQVNLKEWEEELGGIEDGDLSEED